MASPTQPSGEDIDTSLSSETQKFITTLTNEYPLHAKHDSADHKKFYLETRRLVLSKDEEILEIHAQNLRTLQESLELKQEALELKRQLLESIRREIEPSTAFYTPSVLEKMERLDASFKPRGGVIKSTEAEHAGKDAPTLEVFEHANDTLSEKLMASRL